jgi:hypothetical protein
MTADVRAAARRALVRLLADRIVRDALERQAAERAIITAPSPHTAPSTDARRPLRSLQLRLAAPDINR